MARSEVSYETWSGVLAGGLSIGAAAIHFAVTSDHFAEYPPYGVAFAALAWFQVGWAFAYFVRRRAALARLAIVVNGGAVAVWVVSRTIGLPIGPQPGAIEPIGQLDLLAGGLEVVLIALLAWDLRGATRPRPSIATRKAIPSVGSALLTIAVVTTLALAQPPEHGHLHAAPVEPTPLAPARPTSSPLSDASSSPLPTASGPAAIEFGSGFDLTGALAGRTSTYRDGEVAAWAADLPASPADPTVRFVIIQVLPDGREFEHWNQEITLADPTSRRIVGTANLWLYAHNGAGRYRMRFVQGDVVLAEGTFELVP